MGANVGALPPFSALVLNSLTNSIVSSSVIIQHIDSSCCRATSDWPVQIKLQLNIKKRVTAWRSTWISGRTYVTHQSNFSVLIKKKSLFVRWIESVCGCVLWGPLFSPLVISRVPNYLINFNSLQWVDTAINLVKETHSRMIRSLPRCQGDARMHLHRTKHCLWKACTYCINIFNPLPALKHLINR